VGHFIVIDTDFLQELSDKCTTPVPFLNPIVLAAICPVLAFKRSPDCPLIQYKLLPGGKLVHPEIVDARDIGCLVGRVTTPLRTMYIVDRTTVVGRLDMLDVTLNPD
jgi:hypothetical protein